MIWFLVINILVILSAVTDGLRLKGKRRESAQVWSHVLNAVHIATWFIVLALVRFDVLTIAGWSEMIFIVVSYSLIRLGSFNIIHNLVAGINWSYLGMYNFPDFILKKIQNWQPPMILAIYFISYMLGLGFCINQI